MLYIYIYIYIGDQSFCDNFKCIPPIATIPCQVCRLQFFTSDNKIVNCVQCYRSFHQFCHKPIIPDREINTVRLFETWVCDDCCNTPCTSQQAIMMMQRRRPRYTVQVPSMPSLDDKPEDSVGCHNTTISKGTTMRNASTTTPTPTPTIKVVKFESGGMLSTDEATGGSKLN